MKQLVGLQSSESIHLSVLRNVMNEDLYQVKVTFSDKESLFSFLKSENYTLISGSFKVLGMLIEKNVIEYSDFDERQTND